jgi:hypothetical protein
MQASQHEQQCSSTLQAQQWYSKGSTPCMPPLRLLPGLYLHHIQRCEHRFLGRSDFARLAAIFLLRLLLRLLLLSPPRLQLAAHLLHTTHHPLQQVGILRLGCQRCTQACSSSPLEPILLVWAPMCAQILCIMPALQVLVAPKCACQAGYMVWTIMLPG